MARVDQVDRGRQGPVQGREVRHRRRWHPYLHTGGSDSGLGRRSHQLLGVHVDVSVRHLLLEQREGVHRRRVHPNRILTGRAVGRVVVFARVGGVVGPVEVEGAEGDEQVLPQEGLGVLAPRLVEQQRHLQKLHGQRRAARSRSGHSPVGIFAGRGLSGAGRASGGPFQVEPHGLAPHVGDDAPLVGELSQQPQAAAGAGGVRIVAQRGVVRAAVVHLDPQAPAFLDAAAEPDRGAGVDEGIGDHLADQQLGVVDQVGPS
jgi:hypothetical protein